MSFLKLILVLLIAIILLTVLRSVIGVLAKFISGPANPPSAQRRNQPPAGGELKRDPVCGTYVSAATSVKLTAGGEVLHFCSSGCRDKYRRG